MYPPEHNADPFATRVEPVPVPAPPVNLHHKRDAEQAGIPGLPMNGSRSSSWDLLAGVKKFEQGYQGFDTRNASESHLVFADGDVPNNKVSFNTLIFRIYDGICDAGK
jgi:hypothetical protein